MSLRKQFTLFVASFFVLTLSVQAQSQQNDSTEIANEVKLKPRVGLSAGTFTFKGDLGSGLNYNNAGTSPFAYKVFVTAPLWSFLDVEAYMLFSKARINEHGVNQRNFSAQIRTGGVNFKYNFDHFLPKDRKIQPYFSLGVESMEFLTKTDLYDSDGNFYHFWDDGSIRSIDQMADNAQDAQILKRDYIYESDARDSDLYGYGKYKENCISFPIGVGVDMLLTDRFRASFGANYHFTTSDFIDNTADDQADQREIQNGNDNFLYLHAGLSYDLNISLPQTKESLTYVDEHGNEIEVVIDMDGDKDGVNDLVDKDLSAPAGTDSDKNGVPLDGDKDGIPDYRDAEMYSAANAIVDADGVTMTDEDIEKRYLMWIDSIPYPIENWSTDFQRVNSDPRHYSNTYSVIVQKNEDGLTQAEINLLLSFRKLKEKNVNGEKSYFIGEYEQLGEAVKTRNALHKGRIQGRVINKSKDGIRNVSEEEIAADNPNREEIAKMYNSNDIVYRVQIGAYRLPLSEDLFDGVKDLVVIEGDDGLTRYNSGNFDNRQEAAKWKIELLLKGFDGAFITAYRRSKRISLEAAGLTVIDKSLDITEDVENPGINPEMIRYTVKLGEYSDLVPSEDLDQFLKLGDVRVDRMDGGGFVYMSGEFASVEEAEKHMTELSEMGLKNMILVASFNKNIISIEEADQLLKTR